VHRLSLVFSLHSSHLFAEESLLLAFLIVVVDNVRFVWLKRFGGDSAFGSAKKLGLEASLSFRGLRRRHNKTEQRPASFFLSLLIGSAFLLS